jgi:putative transposase
MPRRPRIYIPGLSLHVMQRGNNRAAIFDDDWDCDHFLRLARRATFESGVAVHGYSLMKNHYHFILTPSDKHGLARAMKAIDGGYVRYYNPKHERIGTLWNGRYKARHIDDERYWLTCLRYIELNPIKAHIVADAALYKWSSYRVHAHGESSDWLEPHALYLQLGATASARQAAYRALCATSATDDAAIS